jgi:hypothetical protein
MLLFSSSLTAMKMIFSPITINSLCPVCFELFNCTDFPAVPIHITSPQINAHNYNGHFCHLQCLPICIHQNLLVCPMCQTTIPIIAQENIFREIQQSEKILYIGSLLYFFTQEHPSRRNQRPTEIIKALYIHNKRYASHACFKMKAPYYRLFGQHKAHPHEKQD